MPDFGERLIPTPVGFSSDVKQKAARAERAWEAATGLIGAVSATGTAVVAAGVAVPPVAPFLGLVAAAGFYFKLRAKWAREDPPRPDFTVVTEYRPPRLDLMALMSSGAVPHGAGLPVLLQAAGASVEATVVCAERAQGAALAVQQTAEPEVRVALVERVRETYAHARRTEMLTMGVRADIPALLDSLVITATPGPRFAVVEQARQEWAARYAGRSFADVFDQRAVGHLIAAGLDQRLLSFTLPVEFPSAPPAPPAAPEAAAGAARDDSAFAQGVLAEAGAAAEEFGVALRQWAWEATLDPALDAWVS